MFKAIDYYNSVMYNSPALEVLDMWSGKCYGLLQLGDSCGVLKVMVYYNWVMPNSPKLDVFDMWSSKSYGLLQLGDA